MRYIIFILILPLVASTQEYPIHITEEGYILIEVELADSITGNFILDTGAGANVLSSKLFNQIRSQAEKAGYFTGFRHDGDRLDGTVYQIPYLAVGEARQFKPLVGVYPPLDDYGVDGLLSLMFFEDKPFTINYPEQKLLFHTPDGAPKQTDTNIVLPLSVHKHTNIKLDIFLPVLLNDTLSVLAEFDTGSGHGAYIINTNYIQDLGLDSTQVLHQTYITPLTGQERMDHIYQLSAIAIGGDAAVVRQENIRAIFREKLIYNALIGSGLFKDKAITIDIPNGVFIIDN